MGRVVWPVLLRQVELPVTVLATFLRSRELLGRTRRHENGPIRDPTGAGAGILCLPAALGLDGSGARQGQLLSGRFVVQLLFIPVLRQRKRVFNASPLYEKNHS